MGINSLRQPPGTSATTTTSIASKKDRIQRIQIAKDSANNPEAERLEKIRRFYFKIYIYVTRSGSITWAGFDYHSFTGEDGIDSARDAISPFFLG